MWPNERRHDITTIAATDRERTAMGHKRRNRSRLHVRLLPQRPESRRLVSMALRERTCSCSVLGFRPVRRLRSIRMSIEVDETTLLLNQQ
jgi:hypothetical protein